MYNLGRAREAGGDLVGAVEAYDTFLQQEAATERRSEVELRLVQLRSVLPATRDPTAPSSGALEDPSGASSANATPAPTEHRGAPRYVPWLVLSSGVVVLGTATTLGILGRVQQRDADTEPVQAQAAALQRAAERKALAANVLFGVGGALSVTGAAWLWVDRRRNAKPRAGLDARGWSVRLGPTSVGCTLRY